MRKTILLIILIFLICPPVFAEFVEYPYTPFLVMGYIGSQTSFDVTINEAILPLDFTDSRIAYNSNPERINGIQIGSYSLVTNSSVTLYIAHTKLELKQAFLNAESETGSLDNIDYVLYVVTDSSRGQFSYCYSNSSASAPSGITTENERIQISGSGTNNQVFRRINQGLYLSLDDRQTPNSTATSITNLKSGTYESTIYFLIEEGS